MMRKILWFTAGVAIGATAAFLTPQAIELYGSDVMARAKDIVGRGSKIIGDASELVGRGTIFNV